MKIFAAAVMFVLAGSAAAAQEPVYTKDDKDVKPPVVVAVTVVKSLDKENGLDDEAVAALKEWRFKPATRDGKPVLMKVSVEMTFTLRDKKN